MLNLASRRAEKAARMKTANPQGSIPTPAKAPLWVWYMTKSTDEGATPKLTMSESESSSLPTGENDPVSRAVKPSRKSKTAAATTSQKAVCRSERASA